MPKILDPWKLCLKEQNWISEATYRHEFFSFVPNIESSMKAIKFLHLVLMYNEETYRGSCRVYGKRQKFPFWWKERTYEWKDTWYLVPTWYLLQIILSKCPWSAHLRVAPGILKRKRKPWSKQFCKMSLNKNRLETFNFVPYVKLYTSSLWFYWK